MRQHWGRKSIQPLSARVGGDDQALQQFVNQSPWDHDAVMFRALDGGGFIRPRLGS